MNLITSAAPKKTKSLRHSKYSFTCFLFPSHSLRRLQILIFSSAKCALKMKISFWSPNLKVKLLLLLSHFSRVRLCNPIDGSPPGSSIHGIFQARGTGVGCHCLLQKVKLEEYKWRRCEALTDHGCLLKSEYFILETGRKKTLLGIFTFGFVLSTFECFSFFDYPMRKILTPCFVGWGGGVLCYFTKGLSLMQSHRL